MSDLTELQTQLDNLESGYNAKKKELTALKAKKNPKDASHIKTLEQSVKSYPAIIATKKKAIALLKPSTSNATAQGKDKTPVKPQKLNKAGKPFLKGVQPTYTHGKKMYISLDIHSYNIRTDADIKTVAKTVKRFPNINFTLYIFERDKDKIQKLIKELPNPNISYGLHLDPKAKDPLAQIDRFYKYIEGIQPPSRTPTSVHTGGKYGSKILKRLESKHIPFVRSANNQDNNSPTIKGSAPAVKNVIAADATKKEIDNFKTEDGLKDYDSYYTHPHEVNNKNPNYILNHFNKGVEKQ